MTVVVDDETALWARIEAARKDTSVSKYVGELLRRERLADHSYEAANRSFESRRPQRLSDLGDPYPSRDEMHDR